MVRSLLVAVTVLTFGEGASAQETDGDGDGWCASGRDANGDGECLGESEVGPEGDCDDTDPAIRPGAAEVCDDRRDNDCNGLRDRFDPRCDPARTDADGDGWCARGRDETADGFCLAADGENRPRGDCDEADPSVGPESPERCDDGVDNDCNGLTDDWDLACGGTPIDVDGDRYCPSGGVDRNRDGDCADEGEARIAADCDDGDRESHPGALELCDDDIDQDCDGFVDEGAVCLAGSLQGGPSGGASCARTQAPRRDQDHLGLLGLGVLGLLLRRRRRSVLRRRRRSASQRKA